VLAGNPEGKKQLGIPRRRWEDIEVDAKEIGCEGMDCTHLAEDKD
jgi:hypothetical protein